MIGFQVTLTTLVLIDLLDTNSFNNPFAVPPDVNIEVTVAQGACVTLSLATPKSHARRNQNSRIIGYACYRWKMTVKAMEGADSASVQQATVEICANENRPVQIQVWNAFTTELATSSPATVLALSHTTGDCASIFIATIYFSLYRPRGIQHAETRLLVFYRIMRSYPRKSIGHSMVERIETLRFSSSKKWKEWDTTPFSVCAISGICRNVAVIVTLTLSSRQKMVAVCILE